MMVDINKKLQVTIDILSSDKNSLKDLAAISDYDQFSFYRGSDLSGLDLSGQDLTGLNFDGADLRRCNLAKTKFDLGAFNGAYLSVDHADLKDDFDGEFGDLEYENLERIYLFASFREESLEDAIELAELSYSTLAEVAGISSGTLRKARRSAAVSLESAIAIAQALTRRKGLKNFSNKGALDGVLKQPMIKFLSVNPAGGFLKVERKTVHRLLELVRVISTLNPSRWKRQEEFRWKDGPEMILFLSGINDVAPRQIDLPSMEDRQSDLFG